MLWKSGLIVNQRLMIHSSPQKVSTPLLSSFLSFLGWPIPWSTSHPLINFLLAGVQEVLEDVGLPCAYQRDPTARVWRKETRVSHAITASHIKAWCDGIATPDLKMFLDSKFPHGYDYQRTLNYAKTLFCHFWRHDKRILDVNPDVLRASITALNISSDNWACINFGVRPDMFSDWHLKKVNQIRYSWTPHDSPTKTPMCVLCA